MSFPFECPDDLIDRITDTYRKTPVARRKIGRIGRLIVQSQVIAEDKSKTNVHLITRLQVQSGIESLITIHAAEIVCSLGLPANAIRDVRPQAAEYRIPARKPMLIQGIRLALQII